MSDTIDALRGELFATLRALRDKENPLDIERARAINDTAQVIINSAKVEVDFVKATGKVTGSGFITLPPPPTPEPRKPLSGPYNGSIPTPHTAPIGRM